MSTVVDSANNRSAGTWKAITLVTTALAIAAGSWATVATKDGSAAAESLNTLKQRYDQATLRLSEIEAQLAEAHTRLKTNEEQLTLAAKPDLPVSVAFRPALMGSGLVAMFKNNGNKPLEIAAEFSSGATGANRTANLVLEPGLLKEFGHAEGWAFVPRQHIRLTNNQFRPAEYEVPGS